MTLTLFLPILSFVVSSALAVYVWHWDRVRQRQAQEWHQAILSGSAEYERLRLVTDKLREECVNLSQCLENVTLETRNLSQRMGKVEDYAGVCVPPRTVASGFNINRRVEAIRMFHDGYSEDAIAEELMIPLGEVRLLIHLEKNGAATKTSDAPPKRRTRKVAIA
jgi:hypothetical protein